MAARVRRSLFKIAPLGNHLIGNKGWRPCLGTVLVFEFSFLIVYVCSLGDENEYICDVLLSGINSAMCVQMDFV